jgi:hypothetical protein
MANMRIGYEDLRRIPHSDLALNTALNVNYQAPSADPLVSIAPA